MNIDRKFVDRVCAACKAYDGAADMPTRIARGGELDALVAPLSEGQMRQLVKIVMPRVR